MDGRGWFIDRYEVLRTVSEGHRATVLQALDHVHDRFVALKVYPLVGEDRDSLLAEGRVLMSMVPHAALPVVRGDFFTAERDKYVLVMNWIDGVDLQQVMEQEGQPGLALHDVIEDISSVADALDHLHAHNPPIVHGDVKPANLIRSDEGRVVLVDFDIAATAATVGTAGTTGFIAPEVAGGDKPSPAADIYGLAATVWTLLTGHPPREGSQIDGITSVDQQAEINRTLRNALSTDPAKRPRCARKLVASLRRPPEVRRGLVAMLSVEVDDAARMWREHGEFMRIATRRLRDARDEVIDANGGRVLATLDEGDRWVAVFPEPTSAARAALALQERARLAADDVDFQLRAALVVGVAAAVDDSYVGPLVEQATRLRGLAKPGTTLTSEAAATLLVDMVGPGLSLVPFVPPSSAGHPGDNRLFTLGGPHDTSQPPEPVVRAPGPTRVAVRDVSRIAAASKALASTWTLTFLTAAAFGVIFQLVLSSVLEFEWLGRVVAIVGIAGAIVAFCSCFSGDLRAQDKDLRKKVQDEAAEQHRREHAAERLRLRRRLLDGFDKLASDEASEGALALRALAVEFESITELVQRSSGRPSAILPSLLPALAEDAYRSGVSALSDALEAFEATEGPGYERMCNQLAEIDERLERNAYADERARQRDVQRRQLFARPLARQVESRQRGCDLVFEAERCTAALTEARIELASARAGDTQVDVDAVVQTLEHTIQRVRDVQDELRRLGDD
ncbi:MAG TPA: protein kinase [Ilumatobacteraceae bacterium]